MLNPADIGIAFASFFLVGMMPFALVSLAVPYMVLRLRRDIPEHPQLGLKAGLQYFFSVSIILALCGATVLSVDMMTRDDKAKAAKPNFQFPAPNPALQPKDDKIDEVQRLGLGILLSGLIFTVVHVMLGRGAASGPAGKLVERTFLGWRFAVHGIVVVFTVTILLMILTQENAFDEQKPLYRAIKGLAGVLIVWFPSWIIHLSILYVGTVTARETPPKKYISGDSAED